MIYLDHAATSPARPEVAEAMASEMTVAGNPSALHSAGRRARAAVDDAREALAQAVGCRPSEVIFTSGGTEADNLAVKGTYWAQVAKDDRRRLVAVPETEHHAVLDAALWLAESQGATVVYLPLDATGALDMAKVTPLLTEHAEELAVVSAMWANNETGVIHPIPELAQLTRRLGVPLHADATQGFGRVPMDFRSSGCDMLTVSAHKLGGPVGCGALIATLDCDLVPVQHGGGQERKVRSGTLDPAGLRGFEAALKITMAEQETEAKRLAHLRDKLADGLLALGDVHVTGPALNGVSAERLPHILHVTIAGCAGDALMFLLDNAGICASGGSACSAGVARGSHVVRAMGIPDDRAGGAVRFSLGYDTTEADIDTVLEALPRIVEIARGA